MKPSAALDKVVHLWSPERVERFLAFIPETGGTACKRWRGSLGGKGHGRYRFRHGDRQLSVYAHRAAWILENGEVPRGHEVAHTCPNVDCCNVAHLVVVTSGQRAAMLPERGRSIAGSRHPGVKLTPAQVREMRKLKARHPELTGRELAARFGLASTSWANAIIRGVGWRT